MAGGWGGILGLTGVWPSSPPSVSQAGWRSHLALTGIWVDGAGAAIEEPGEGAREQYPRKRLETEEEELLFLMQCAYRAGYLN